MLTQKTSLPLLTTSAAKTYRSCPRKFLLSYEQGYRARLGDEALRFGSLFHVGQETWWTAVMNGAEDPYGDAIAAMREASVDEDIQIDEAGLIRAETMLAGYNARYVDELVGDGRRLDILAVEAEFVGPLVNPLTGADSRTWRLGGKIDAIVRDVTTGKVYVVEHKTSAEDLSGGSDYWARLTLDPQISNYLVGARLLADRLGYAPSDVAGVIYDVIAKPAQRPLLATPEEARKYTKATAKEASRLYAGQRADDETMAEYQDRLVGVIEKDPERFFARGEIVRLESEVREAATDLWHVGTQIRDARRLNVWPRNPDACLKFSKRCPFFGVCTGTARIEDPSRFRKTTHANEELSPEVEPQTTAA